MLLPRIMDCPRLAKRFEAALTIKRMCLIAHEDKGYLDEQFVQLEELQDDENPNFVAEIVTSYYSDSARLIQKIDHALTRHPVDFDMLDNYMHQFKGSSSSIGAKKVVQECSHFRDLCAAGNTEGCIKSFQMIKQEHSVLRNKLESYIQLITSTEGY